MGCISLNPGYICPTQLTIDFFSRQTEEAIIKLNSNRVLTITEVIVNNYYYFHCYDHYRCKELDTSILIFNDDIIDRLELEEDLIFISRFELMDIE